MVAAAYIEPRPKSREPHTAISHYTIVSGGQDHVEFRTQEAAIEHACNEGYRPVHVARVRHSPSTAIRIIFAITCAKGIEFGLPMVCRAWRRGR